MYWLHLTKKQKKRITQTLGTAEIQDPFADQSESLDCSDNDGNCGNGEAIGY